MESLIDVSAGDALRYARMVDDRERLIGYRMAAMSGNSPVSLKSLREVESFFVVLTQEQVLSMDMRQRIHFIEPNALIRWVRDVVGDTGLADRLGEVVSGGEVYGALVPKIKQLIAERLGEYDAAIEGTKERDKR